MFEHFAHLVGDERPLSWLFQFWPVLLSSFICGLIATILCRKIAIKYGIVDRPDDTVKTHKVPTAYLGGIGIFIGLSVGLFMGVKLFKNDFIADRWLIAVWRGATVACFVGLIDDVYNLRPEHKIIGQIIASVSLIIPGITPALNEIFKPLGWTMPYWMGATAGSAIVIFTVLGASNSLNLLDGLDGLCGGVTIIITLALLFLSVHLATVVPNEINDPVRMMVCLALLGGVAGFLPFNRAPAKIFMGDAGSMLLGYVVAALMMLCAKTHPRWWIASITVLGFPILDTSVAVVRRWLNKRPIFVSDRGHIYDQMIDRGIPLKRTVLICYVLTSVYAFIGITMIEIRTRYAIFVFLATCIISAIIVWQKGYLKMEGLRGAIRKNGESNNSAGSKN